MNMPASNSNKPLVTIYTDGACSGNPGPGGWGAVLIYGKVEKDIYGYELDTTNNRMELKAAIEALKELKKPCKVDLYTDSVYLRSAMTDWIIKWQQNNFRKSDNSLVKNFDLWQNLLELEKKHQISWHWVKGHSGDKYNDKADLLSVKGRDEAKKKVADANR